MTSLSMEFFDKERDEHLDLEIEITYSTPYVAATFHDPAEGGDIEYTVMLDGVEYFAPDDQGCELTDLVIKAYEKHLEEGY